MAGRRAPLALATVACLLVAGCSGATPASPPEPTTPTVTPAPLPSETPPELTPTPPPGSPVAVASLRDLPATHAAALSNRSFTAVERRVVLEGGGALYDVTTRLRVDGGRYRYERTRIADPSYPGPQGIDTLSLYHAGNRTAFRDEDDGGVRYGVVDGPFRFGPDGDHTGRAFLADLVPAFGAWTAAPAGEATLLRGSDLVDPEAIEVDRRLGPPDVASVRVRVTPTGRVSSVDLTYDATLNGRQVTVRVERRYTAVESTAVPEPPWLGRARGTEAPGASMVRP